MADIVAAGGRRQAPGASPLTPHTLRLTPRRVLHEITRLGQDLHNRKSFHPDAVRRSLRALDRMQAEFRRLGVESAAGICTEAFRSARNGPRLLAEIRRRYGWNVRIVSAREEASFAMKGILYGLKRLREPVNSERQPGPIATSRPHDLTTSRILVIDIGGGSTEFIVYDGSLRGIRTTPLGVVRLTETFLKHDPPTASEIDTLRRAIDEQLTPVAKTLSRSAVGGRRSVDAFIGTAGTVTTLAALKLRLKKYDAARVTGTRITQRDLESLFQSLAAVPSKERLARPGMEEGREDLILSGIQILLRTMRRFNLRSLVASDPGILEGIALSLVDT